MIKIYILLILTCLFFSGCRKDIPEPEPESVPLPQVDEYYFQYMDFGESVYPNYENKGIVTIKHLDGKIVMRQGGLIITGGPYNYKFLTGVYDSLTYIGSEIFIKTRFANQTEYLFMSDQYITVDKKGRMIKKIKPSGPGDKNRKDTLTYSYSSKSQITRIKGNHYLDFRESLFYYNDKNNLDSVVTIQVDWYDKIVEYKRTDHFSDYDNAKNPLKELVIFDETFYRSLSANNFRYWKTKEYKTDSHGESNTERKYTLKYDEARNVLFNSF